MWQKKLFGFARVSEEVHRIYHSEYVGMLGN